MIKEYAERILELAKSNGALTYGTFRLSSGKTSTYYFDGRILTLDPEGGYIVGKAFLEILRSSRAEAIAGPTLGADPIVSSVAALSYAEGWPIPGLIVRKEAKSHGGQRAIEGPLKRGSKVAIVDDTCTTGTSLFMAIEALEAEECEVIMVMVILDRKEGGSDKIRRHGYPFKTLLEASCAGEIKVMEG